MDSNQKSLGALWRHLASRLVKNIGMELCKLEFNAFTHCATAPALTTLVNKQGCPQGNQEIVYGLSPQTRD